MWFIKMNSLQEDEINFFFSYVDSIVIQCLELSPHSKKILGSVIFFILKPRDFTVTSITIRTFTIPKTFGIWN